MDQPTLTEDASQEPSFNLDDMAAPIAGAAPVARVERADGVGQIETYTVIYAREGKILAQFAPDADPDAQDKVREAIYSLWLHH